MSGNYYGASGSERTKDVYFDTYDSISAVNAKIAPVATRQKRPLVGDMPAGLKTLPNLNQPHGSTAALAPASTSLGFGLGLGRYGNEVPSPMDAEVQQTVLEMQQELAFLETSSSNENCRHSIRLLKEKCAKLENTVDPDWVEVDINKPIRVTKRILIPTFRHPTLNYVGRILGPKGATLQNICKKYKAHISIMGAGSTKDSAKELELLNSGDPRFAHYSSPLHVRVDIIAPPQVAHTRLAGILNLFSKLLMPVKEVIIDGINDPEALSRTTENGESTDGQLEQEIEEHVVEDAGGGRAVVFASGSKRVSQNETSSSADVGDSPPSKKAARGGRVSTRGRGGGGGFVPRARKLDLFVDIALRGIDRSYIESVVV